MSRNDVMKSPPERSARGFFASGMREPAHVQKTGVPGVFSCRAQATPECFRAAAGSGRKKGEAALLMPSAGACFRCRTLGRDLFLNPRSSGSVAISFGREKALRQEGLFGPAPGLCLRVREVWGVPVIREDEREEEKISASWKAATG